MRRAGPAAEEGYADENVTNWQPAQNRQQAAIGGQSIIFMYRPVLNPEKSKEDGRPRYDRVPFVRISQPGDRDNVIQRQVWLDETESNIMADNVRFKAKWEAFIAGQEIAEEGTPLEYWPALTSEQRAELAHFNVRTVEQLASLTDVNAKKFLGIQALKKLAQDFLDAAKDGAVITKLHGEVEKREAQNKEFEHQLHEQAETIRQLRQMVEAQQRIHSDVARPPADPEIVHEPTGSQEAAPAARPFLKPRVK